MTVIDGREWLTRPGSVGRAASGEIAVLRPDGIQADPGEAGEIFMRATPGADTYHYIGAEAQRVAGGWESIGDLGFLDADGYLYLNERKSDMILVGGANIYPAEIEAVITEHPAVRSCALVGLPDEDLGHRLHAVLESEPELDEPTVRSFLSDRLSAAKQPHSYRFVDYPLRDDAGKLRRSLVLAEELAHLAQVSGGADR